MMVAGDPADEGTNLQRRCRHLAAVRAACAVIAVLAIATLVASAPARAEGPVHVMSVHGVINPVSAGMIATGIERAEEAGAAALVIELDTPGGLLKSVHEISKTMLSAEVPIVVYVFPEGARATSAGVLVTVSAHVAAMARGTHIGAAHVVTAQGAIQDTIVNEKAMNDWVAELRAVARLRGRNEDWVELAARESASVVAEEAAEIGVVDMVVPSLDSLLVAVDGMRVEVAGDSVTIGTKGSVVQRFAPSFRDRILAVISDPSVAYILFLVGIYGLIFELSNPGSILPGVAGAICIILALFSLHTLPLDYAGLLLIALAIVLFILETQIPSFGILTLGGVAAMIFGSIMLLDKAGPLFTLSLGLIIPAALFTGALMFFLLSKGLLAQRSRPATGVEGLVGEEGIARTDLAPRGKVFLHGEIWEAEVAEGASRSPGRGIASGARVRVVGVRGMVLVVKEEQPEAQEG